MNKKKILFGLLVLPPFLLACSIGGGGGSILGGNGLQPTVPNAPPNDLCGGQVAEGYMRGVNSGPDVNARCSATNVAARETNVVINANNAAIIAQQTAAANETSSP